MAGPRPEKVAVVEEVREHLDNSGAAILTEYRGLKVADLAALRRQLRTAGAEYKIFKNTLVRRATTGTDRAALDPLPGGADGDRLRPGRCRSGREGAAGFQPAASRARRQGRFPRYPAGRRPRCGRPRGPAVARGVAGPARRGDGRSDAAVRRSAAGAAAQLRLRAVGTDREARRRGASAPAGVATAEPAVAEPAAATAEPAVAEPAAATAEPAVAEPAAATAEPAVAEPAAATAEPGEAAEPSGTAEPGAVADADGTDTAEPAAAAETAAPAEGDNAEPAAAAETAAPAEGDNAEPAGG